MSYYNTNDRSNDSNYNSHGNNGSGYNQWNQYNNQHVQQNYQDYHQYHQYHQQQQQQVYDSSYGYEPSADDVTPTEPLSYEQHPYNTSLPRNFTTVENQYDSFIVHGNGRMGRPAPPVIPSNSRIQTPPTAYNETFVQPNHTPMPNEAHMFQVPSINVIQTPSDFTQDSTIDLVNTQNRQQHQYGEDNYHQQPDGTYSGNNSVTNFRSSTALSNTPSDVSNNDETYPILNNYSQQHLYNDANNTNSASVDLEDSYIDQNGDDYQINSYLGRDGEVIDPYSGGLLAIYDNKDDDSEFSNELDKEYRDLGDYSDANTINKLAAVKSRSLLSSTSSSSALNAPLLEQDMGDSSESTKRNLPRRATTKIRKFKLFRGNFVFDSPISASLLDRYSLAVDKENVLSNEFKFMRYQAITCGPQELAMKNFTVRQLKYMRPRETELMIVITMYNEDHVLLGRTLKGVMDNIKYMVKRTRSSTWGPDAWKKIVVCVVSDGRSKINEKSLALLSALGCYQDGFAKDEINDQKVAMHMYEHTTMMNISSVDENGIELVCNQSTVPVQLLFALKEQNQKKINSHRWAFEGFAELLQPRIVTLLDAGTMPGKDSIYELWREFRSPIVGGACGEIKTFLGKGFTKLVNPLIASQNFEYKMSNILDKTTESNFGFITVLPGAFSAYRFEAVRGQPLEKYFYGEGLEDKGFNFFSSNMYLAEDRILCFEIVTKKHSNWVLKYCRSSYASTDVPERVPEFILQRRRWLNGSFFAAVYSFCHVHRVWTSGHNVFRKLWLTFEFLYLLFNTIISWFSLSSFFLVFRILSLSIALKYHKVYGVLSVVFLWLYGVSIFSTFILSLGNKPKSTEKYYVLNFLFFAVLMCYMLFCSIFMAVKSFEDILDGPHITFEGLITKRTFRDMVISMGSTYVLYFASSIIYLQPWHMITSFVQYILLSPSYINVLNIYAFCNVHDLSWGTKGSVSKSSLGKITSKEDGTFKMEVLVSNAEIQANYNKFMEILNDNSTPEDSGDSLSYEEKKTGYYANVRALVIIFWVMTNFGVVAAVLETGGIGDYLSMRHGNAGELDQQFQKPLLTANATVYFTIILWLVALSAVIRFFGCAAYMSNRFFNRLFRK